MLPGITDENQKNRTRDELPQSAAGKTIMTTEPKFVPKEAARIALGEDTAVQVRLVDCVGFMTEGAGSILPCCPFAAWERSRGCFWLCAVTI